MMRQLPSLTVSCAAVLLRWLCVLVLGLLTACSWFQGSTKEEKIGRTLAQLEPAVMPNIDTPMPEFDLAEIEANYRRALAVAVDPEIRRNILVRLADVEMSRSEENQLDATTQGKFFNDAISMYGELIDLTDKSAKEKFGIEGGAVEDPDSPWRDKLIYQLAKAYALEGKMEESAAALDRLSREYPNSPYIGEVQFRRAERAFSDSDYSAAEQGYQAVVALGKNTPFYANSLYMLGWTQFKRNRYERAIESFTQVLDGLLASAGDLQKVTGLQKNLLDDTLHVTSIIFSYLDGAKSITETYQRLGERPYNHLLYLSLGELFLEKGRYRDSADTLTQYVDSHPNSDHAPSFSVKLIDVYTKGDFPSLILPAKESFVRHYGIRSAYWANKEPIREKLRSHLHTYLQELAEYQHAEALKHKRDLKKALAKKSSKKKQKKSFNPVEEQKKIEKKFLTAARWYREFLDTFPDNKQTPHVTFLMAESLFEAHQLPPAFAAYEKVAYDYLDKKHGAEAGYSAILTAEKLVEQEKANAIKSTPPPSVQGKDSTVAMTWEQKKTQSALKFSDYYGHDKRAATVLTKAAQELLDQGAPSKAIAAAERLTKWQPRLNKALLKTAWLVLGQSQFDLKNYAKAESAYLQVLKLLPAKDPARANIVERVAASTYKNAEQKLAGENKAEAVEQLLRVKNIAPTSDIAAKAQYDAVNYLMEMKQWARAQKVMSEFRQRYPKHPLTPTLPAKLVVVYEQTKQWSRAADELSLMATLGKDTEVRRKSLYLAAEYYERGKNINKAITRYQDYAKSYPKPYDQLMEARFKLTELYKNAGQLGQRKLWLKHLVEGDKRAGAARNDRSRYLAAFASSELADEIFQQFMRIPLKLPLKKSMANKKTALKKTLAVYENILDYKVAEFSTLANYRIGAVYAQLSRDLMNSQRPKNLDTLALEQYEILLEEQAFPFEEKAIEIHESNAKRSWQGIYDESVKKSFAELAKLLPARFGKQERKLEFSRAIY